MRSFQTYGTEQSLQSGRRRTMDDKPITLVRRSMHMESMSCDSDQVMSKCSESHLGCLLPPRSKCIYIGIRKRMLGCQIGSMDSLDVLKRWLNLLLFERNDNVKHLASWPAYIMLYDASSTRLPFTPVFSESLSLNFGA